MARAPGTHVTEVLQAHGAVTRLDLAALRLFVPAGPDKGKSVALGAAPVTVGADPACELVLSDRSVSRRHAEVRLEGGLARVRDLGSTNGTFFHGGRVSEVAVPPGGEVSFGKARVRLVPDEVAVEPRSHAAERLGPLIGGDPRMREIFALIDDIADSDVTVVVEGETGTGKELVARAIHETSRRKRGDLVVFDCTNQPKELIESSLFGHVKGAFTGATGARAGAFQRAHGGTIFLDELGEFTLDLQPKLLRVLESREVQRVGGEAYEAVDVRVVAATNRNLRAEVRQGRFREDLYYRLAVLKIQLPALRERRGDIPLLVDHFLELAGASVRPEPRGLERLLAHDWPGNVRELKNVVDRAVALSRNRATVDLSAFLMAEDLGPPAAPAPAPAATAASSSSLPFKEAKGRILAEFESRYIEDLLREHDHNISVAAREAGIDRKHFKDLMRKHGIAVPRADDDD